MKRLQGEEFMEMKHKLRARHITKFSMSEKGNIRVDFKYGNFKFYHWLNDVEKVAFLNSDFYLRRKDNE